MKTLILLPLQPDADHVHDLEKVITRVTDATNYISEFAFTKGLFHPSELHPLLYSEIRQQFGLSSQHVVLALGRVAEAYKSMVKLNTALWFDSIGGIPYDEKMLTINRHDVSILSVNKRMKIPHSIDTSELRKSEIKSNESWLFNFEKKFFIQKIVNLNLINDTLYSEMINNLKLKDLV